METQIVLWVVLFYFISCFIANEKLFKMGIKKSPNCSLCKNEIDSVEHMLIDCPISKDLWFEVQDWIVELGIPNYNITKEKIIMGELERSLCINSIILLTKKETKVPHILMVKNETELLLSREISFVYDG